LPDKPQYSILLEALETLSIFYWKPENLINVLLEALIFILLETREISSIFCWKLGKPCQYFTGSQINLINILLEA
jgi:hypothetical protein